MRRTWWDSGIMSAFREVPIMHTPRGLLPRPSNQRYHNQGQNLMPDIKAKTRTNTRSKTHTTLTAIRSVVRFLNPSKKTSGNMARRSSPNCVSGGRSIISN